MSSSELITIRRLKWLDETEKAFKVQQGDKAPCWVPKSQCEHVSKNVQFKEIGFTIPEWLADAKDLDE